MMFLLVSLLLSIAIDIKQSMAQHNGNASGELRVGFYTRKCPQAEEIVAQVVRQHISSDASLAPALLRMHFHDCFIRGCDASILLDSSRTNAAPEKEATPNLTVRGFEIIDDAKSELEQRCPFTVSCADIIALATRDAVHLMGGPQYSIPTGRRDGRISSMKDVNIPGPDSDVSFAAQAFARKSLSVEDMVTLLGAHTVGISHCNFFSGRIYDFGGRKGSVDPTMDRDFAARLQNVCPPPNLQSKRKNPTVFLDEISGAAFDNGFFRALLMKRGLLRLDQQLSLDRATKGLVSSYASDLALFRTRFVDSVVRMGTLDVLTGSNGEIRRRCRAVNGQDLG